MSHGKISGQISEWNQINLNIFFFFFFENNDISENNQKCSTVPEAVCTKLTEH